MQKSKECKVFPSEGGLRVVRQTSREQAEMMEALGVFRREYDTRSGALIGFRIIGAEAAKVDGDLQSMRTSASISPKEMQLNVGHSRTRGLRELDRLKLIKDGFPPEDEVERVQAKVRVYPLIGAAQGDILRAWPL